MVDGHVIKPCKSRVKQCKGMSDEWCNQSHLEKGKPWIPMAWTFRLRLDGEGSTPSAKDS